MESAALGAAASRRGVPFVIVRTVSDLVNEDLPLDFNHFLKPTGWVYGMQALFARPSALVGLNRLRKQSFIAAERLTKVFAHYAVEEIGVGEART
jgi:adenosylhomocysteine nucleosidase